ncbi:MAG: DUF1016 domain-containing protein [Gammaproteobacteria bacterium]|nr:DUF1016 domain-containing protein [Gammaproteobacteria bacterium]
MNQPQPALSGIRPVLCDIQQLIEQNRQRVSGYVNATLTLLYWHIGRRIQQEDNGRRAEYGKQILATLSQELTRRHGKGFNEPALNRMVKFAGEFPDSEKVATLSQQLSWSHWVLLLPLKDTQKREFYAQMCATERWSVRQFKQRINSMLYERTALSKQPDQLIRKELDSINQDRPLNPNLLLKDPYILDFLGLNDHYLEKDLEDAILREIERFLLELGAGFTFMARQKRIAVGQKDYYIDLLFYNRKLRRLVAIDLKLGDFQPEYKGQMELYLRWLAKYEQQADELPPLGIILCAGKEQEEVELLEMGRSGIHVAQYLTELPPPEVLTQQLHRAIAAARARLEARE